LVLIIIQEEGAMAVADALKDNLSLTYLDIGANSIQNEGARVIADALKVNTSLTYLLFAGI
jgi:Leucine Rich repeat